MIGTRQEAVTTLHAAGLAASITSLGSLQIGSSLDDVGDGLRIFRDGCAMNPLNGEWIALLPAGGLTQYEVPGTLAEGVALILAAYEDHRKNGGPFHEACKRVLKDAERYLIGSSLAGV